VTGGRIDTGVISAAEVIENIVNGIPLCLKSLSIKSPLSNSNGIRRPHRVQGQGFWLINSRAHIFSFEENRYHQRVGYFLMKGAEMVSIDEIVYFMWPLYKSLS